MIQSRGFLFGMAHQKQVFDGRYRGTSVKCAVVKRVSKGRMSPAKAKDLFDAARVSAGIVEGCFSVGLEIQATLEAIAAIDDFVVRLEAEVSRRLDEIPYSHHLL